MFIQFLFFLLNYSIFKDPSIPRKPNNETFSAIISLDTPPTLRPDIIFLLASQKARSIVQNTGEDFRPDYTRKPEVSIQQILLQQNNKSFLDKLESDEYTNEEKLDMIKKDLEPPYKGFDIYAGGLLNDW
jgi:hypothetical protein